MMLRLGFAKLLVMFNNGLRTREIHIYLEQFRLKMIGHYHIKQKQARECSEIVKPYPKPLESNPV